MNNPNLKLVKNSLQNILDNDLISVSLKKEFSTGNLAINPNANSLKDIFQNFAICALPLNKNLRNFDPERELFEYETDILISDIKKDSETHNLKKSFPIFNSKKYFKIFLEGDLNQSYQKRNIKFLPEKEFNWEKTPIRIELISKIQKNLGIRAKTPLVLSETLEILDSLINNDVKLEKSDIDVIEEEVKDLNQLCQDANYFLKKIAFEDFLGKKQKKLISDYQNYFTQCNYLIIR